MTATKIVLIQLLCAFVLASVSSYLGGRVHQRQREGDGRRNAFRDGFLRASTALVPLSGGSERMAPHSQRSGAVISAAEKEKRIR